MKGRYFPAGQAEVARQIRDAVEHERRRLLRHFGTETFARVEGELKALEAEQRDRIIREEIAPEVVCGVIEECRHRKEAAEAVYNKRIREIGIEETEKRYCLLDPIHEKVTNAQISLEFLGKVPKSIDSDFEKFAYSLGNSDALEDREINARYEEHLKSIIGPLRYRAEGGMVHSVLFMQLVGSPHIEALKASSSITKADVVEQQKAKWRKELKESMDLLSRREKEINRIFDGKYSEAKADWDHEVKEADGMLDELYGFFVGSRLANLERRLERAKKVIEYVEPMARGAEEEAFKVAISTLKRCKQVPAHMPAKLFEASFESRLAGGLD